MNTIPKCTGTESWPELTQCLLNSFRHWTGSELIERKTPEEDLLNLWCDRQVVVAHGTQADPAFVYGNQAALNLWEMQLDEFLGMPSRMTAEPVHRDERERLLKRTREFGYVDDYRGVRISKTGKRFLIEQATLWMVLDATGAVIGQAATFESVSRLDAISGT